MVSNICLFWNMSDVFSLILKNHKLHLFLLFDLVCSEVLIFRHSKKSRTDPNQSCLKNRYQKLLYWCRYSYIPSSSTSFNSSSFSSSHFSSFLRFASIFFCSLSLDLMLKPIFTAMVRKISPIKIAPTQ